MFAYSAEDIKLAGCDKGMPCLIIQSHAQLADCDKEVHYSSDCDKGVPWLYGLVPMQLADCNKAIKGCPVNYSYS